MVSSPSSSDAGGLSGLNAFIAGIHAFDGALVPLQIDLRLLVIADAVHELVNEAHPFVEIGVLDRISIRHTFLHFILVSCRFLPKHLELSRIIPIFAALLGSPWR